MPALPTLLATLAAAAPGTLTAPAPASVPVPAGDVQAAPGAPAVVARRARDGGWAAPRRWAALPRRFSVVRAAAVEEDNYQPVHGLVALDPRTRETRVVSGTPTAYDEDMGPRWPRGLTFLTADMNNDGAEDLVGVDARTGLVRVAYNDVVRFRMSRLRWRIPRGAQLTAGDVDGDSFGDLVYRPRGRDAVFVRRGRVVAQGDAIAYRFRPAVRAGRWDRLTLSAARPPTSGRRAR